MSEQSYPDGWYVAVVGDGDEAEPIRVQGDKWYSAGCADPHSMDSVYIVRAILMNAPTKAERAEQERWAKLRESNYQEYKRQWRNKYGRDPGHRRWPDTGSEAPGGPKTPTDPGREP